MNTEPQATEPVVEIKAIWAEPAEGITLDDLIEEMKTIGNKVIKVDRKNNRLGLAL